MSTANAQTVVEKGSPRLFCGLSTVPLDRLPVDFLRGARRFLPSPNQAFQDSVETALESLVEIVMILN